MAMEAVGRAAGSVVVDDIQSLAVAAREAAVKVAREYSVPVPPGLPGIDYGADEYTRGRPHPMIDPTLRDAGLAAALDDESVAAILFDIVIGTGANADPAEHAANAVAAAGTRAECAIACVVGTDLDAQNRAAQVRTLEEAGIVVAPSHAAAACLAIAIATR